MQIYKVQLSDEIIDILIERKRIRNYYIKISPNLTVTVSIPLSMDMESVEKFIYSHNPRTNATST